MSFIFIYPCHPVAIPPLRVHFCAAFHSLSIFPKKSVCFQHQSEALGYDLNNYYLDTENMAVGASECGSLHGSIA